MKVFSVVFLLLFIALFANAKVVKRALGPETVQLQLEYLGSCDDFNGADRASVHLSKVTNGECLPITDAGADLNNLQADYFCSDIGQNRAIVHFVEVFENVEGDTTKFVLSFIPTRPFRAHVPTGTFEYARRPNCKTNNLFCEPYTPFVVTCNPNRVEIKRRYVLSQDRIYISVNNKLSDTCHTTTVPGCCAYVAVSPPTSTGICPYTAPTTLNSFPKKKPHRPEHHKEEHHKPEHQGYEGDRHGDDHREGDDHRQQDEYRHGDNHRQGDNRRPGDNHREDNEDDDKKKRQIEYN